MGGEFLESPFAFFGSLVEGAGDVLDFKTDITNLFSEDAGATTAQPVVNQAGPPLGGVSTLENQAVVQPTVKSEPITANVTGGAAAFDTKTLILLGAAGLLALVVVLRVTR